MAPILCNVNIVSDLLLHALLQNSLTFLSNHTASNNNPTHRFILLVLFTWHKLEMHCQKQWQFCVEKQYPWNQHLSFLWWLLKQILVCATLPPSEYGSVLPWRQWDLLFLPTEAKCLSFGGRKDISSGQRTC